jgi:hypothetical protein
MSSEKPIHEMRVGKIKAAIWADPTDQGTRHNVSLARLYMGEESWRSSDTFAREDIPLLIKLLVTAYDWMYKSGDVDNSEQEKP